MERIWARRRTFSEEPWSCGIGFAFLHAVAGFYEYRLLRTFKDQIGEVTRKSILWGWLASTDLYIAADRRMMVTDQNLSSPTGIELLARLIDRTRVESVTAFNDLACRMAESVVTYGNGSAAASTVVLDPCRYNPTFRENEYLARMIGSQIVHAGELVVTKDGVELVSGMKRTRVHTIVHRIDDDLLDPNCFRPDSLVGLPGLCKAWKSGRVDLLNPLGSSAANIRSFDQLVPTMIREFLGEEPVLQIAHSHACSTPEAIRQLIENPTHFAVRTNDPMHPSLPELSMSFATQHARQSATIAMTIPMTFAGVTSRRMWRTLSRYKPEPKSACFGLSISLKDVDWVDSACRNFCSRHFQKMISHSEASTCRRATQQLPSIASDPPRAATCSRLAILG